jgi:hypothetical protein
MSPFVIYEESGDINAKPGVYLCIMSGAWAFPQFFNYIIQCTFILNPRFKILIETVSKRFFLPYQFDGLSNT